MKLSELLANFIRLSEKDLNVTKQIDVKGLALDSRLAKEGELFVGLAGTSQHGMAFADKAVSKGVSAILFDPAKGGTRFAKQIHGIPVLPIKNLGTELGKLAARFYDDPSAQLDVIGITGTNGKTSCSQFLGQMLDDCGIIGTLGWGEWGRLADTVNTTPDVITIQRIMREFADKNKKAVAMEVSSHGLDQGRVNSVHFKGAVYTNISRDHLDYHGTMEEYLAAKLKLVQMPRVQFVVINLDDSYCEKINGAAPASVGRWCVSAQGKQADWGESVTTKAIRHDYDGIEFEVVWRNEIQAMKAPLYGDFNVENLLCVIAVMLALGFALPDIAKRIAKLKPVPGRLERCGTSAGELNVFIDYAHSPDALNRVLAVLRKHCNGQLWVVFGCGGNRDAGKRPQMGNIAEQWADHVVITDDNPRFEDNVAIAKEILAGCVSKKVISILDRKQAIEHAVAQAAEQDCILVAGKGHETYQEIKGIQYPFNDKEVAGQALQHRFGVQ